MLLRGSGAAGNPEQYSGCAPSCETALCGGRFCSYEILVLAIASLRGGWLGDAVPLTLVPGPVALFVLDTGPGPTALRAGSKPDSVIATSTELSIVLRKESEMYKLELIFTVTTYTPQREPPILTADYNHNSLSYSQAQRSTTKQPGHFVIFIYYRYTNCVTSVGLHRGSVVEVR